MITILQKQKWNIREVLSTELIGHCKRFSQVGWRGAQDIEKNSIV